MQTILSEVSYIFKRLKTFIHNIPLKYIQVNLWKTG